MHWGVTPKNVGDFGRSVTTFSAPKNGNFWKFLGEIGFSDQFLAPQAPKILRNLGILEKKSPYFVKDEDFIS